MAVTLDNCTDCGRKIEHEEQIFSRGYAVKEDGSSELFRVRCIPCHILRKSSNKFCSRALETAWKTRRIDLLKKFFGFSEQDVWEASRIVSSINR